MGAILSDFPQLPADNNTGGFDGVYADLTALGLPLPAQAANVITRVQLLAHLQAQAGELVKTELTADPEGLYAAATDAQLAGIIGREFTPQQARRLPGSSQTGYVVVAGATQNALVLAVNPGLANPGFLSIAGTARASIRMRANGSVVAIPNRGFISPVLVVSGDATLTLRAPLPVAPTVGDLCDLGFVLPPQEIPRLAQIWRRLPYAPNAVTAADITAAKV